MTSWRMRPTASAFGVIAIVSAMITATASEAENGATLRGINHTGVDEEDRHFQEDERFANETGKSFNTNVRAIHAVRNDTASEATMPKEPLYSTTSRQEWTSVSQASTIDLPEARIDKPQGDHSDVNSDLASLNDHGLLESRRRIWEQDSPENKAQDPTPRDFEATTLSSQVEASSRGLAESAMTTSRKMEDLEDLQPEDEGVSNVVVDDADGQPEEDSRSQEQNKDSSGGAATSTRETIVTDDVARPIEQKNVDDIRAISFQVPPPKADDFEDQERHQLRGTRKNDDEPTKVVEARKDRSRPLNNLLLGTGKSTKAFYEIKPSIKTEMEKDDDQQATSSTQKALHGRKFILPSVDSAIGKFGPYFEDGDQEINITARIGSTVLIDCKIGMLGDKEVTWTQHSKDSFRLLTVGRKPYSVDQRISLNFRYPSNWRLQILYASPRDSGLYKCQVATHPVLVKKISVIVTAPELTITDDSGRVVSKERHLKAGSALKLRCEARDVLESLKESVVWTRGDETLTDDVSENRTTEVSTGKEILVIVSTLIVERASPRHAGNYSCVVPGKAKTTIAVHVLNGELPAAVHDGNGVSRAFLNLWLIHLTMSYVFSR